MNQILLTNEETGKSSNGMKPVIRFFAVVAIVFAIVLIVEGILHLYNNLNKRNDYSKPQLSYEKNGSSINLKVDGEIGLNKVTYSWNDGNETVLSADGRKSVSYNIEIPQGDSTLKAVVKDVEGHETKFEDIEISFNESDDTVKPEIKIENVSGKLEVTATDEKEIDYCESKKDPARIQSYAARFAAKEAIFKAISKVLPLDYGMEWKSIEILKEETGRPYVNLKIDNIKKQNLKIDVSLSHIKDCAVATAVAIYEE